ncbi:MAG TPA: OmcA/MtrC family decaheme c-type cytochrome [Thermoanaerobaculia bacterium]|nr:OmcA/MtrC family decaheme c-type cytochrome [Thermoanaerobaculia bacterium]
MSGILRAIVILATAGTISFPTQPPDQSNPVQQNGSARRRAVGAPTTPAKPQFAVSQLEYYLNDDGIAYIRPGLKIKLNSITIGADRKPVVDLNLTDNFDQPLDRLGKVTPGVINPSFILAWYNPATREYKSYITRSATGAANSPNPGVKVNQATSDSGGKWVDLEMGHAKYTFGNALPEGFDQSKTHTLGVQAVRNLTVEIGKNYIANLEYDFRPDGQKVTETWAKINDATSCLNCHDKETFGFHGSSARRDVKLCALCHQSQTIDPDTGNSVDLKSMIHKIHAPGELTKPFVIWGFNSSIHDYSEVTYPQDVRNCDNCHEGTVPAQKPAQATAFLENPTRNACGSCHEDINWTTGANHPAGPQPNDVACATCHVPDSGEEFDASIKGAHTIPTKSKQLAGLKAAIVNVKDMAAGLSPTITYKITDGKGNAVDGSKLSTFSPIFAGPTTSYTNYYRENAVGKGVFDAATGTTTYTFTAKTPTSASGTWVVSADVYKTNTLKRADGKPDITNVRDAAMNPIKYVALDGGKATPRRMSVAIAQCNSCHDKLALHGGQRLTTEECVICHNPTMDDKAQRPADRGAPESISFQRLIHRIHSGLELDQDFTVYGFGKSEHNYNEVTFPGDRRNCLKCHVNTAAYAVPPAKGAAPVITLRDYFSPQGPGTAACLGCHDNQDAAAHAYLNTTNFGGTTTAEACGTCHGTGHEWGVDKVHAR